MFLLILILLCNCFSAKNSAWKTKNVNFIDPNTGLRYNQSPRNKKLYRCIKKSSLSCRGSLQFDYWKGDLKVPVNNSVNKHNHQYSKKSERKNKFMKALKKESVEKKD